MTVSKFLGRGLGGLALAVASPALLALGLGPVEVKSGFNQPLLAEVEILSVRPGELESLRVGLAAPDAFSRVGLDPPSGVTANLRFEVGRDDQGRPVIRITTPGPVRDPYLVFLIDAQWAGGRLVREYSLLIDPPQIAPLVIKPLAPVVAAPSTAPPAVPAPVEQIEAPDAPAGVEPPDAVVALDEPAPAAAEALTPQVPASDGPLAPGPPAAEAVAEPEAASPEPPVIAALPDAPPPAPFGRESGPRSEPTAAAAPPAPSSTTFGGERTVLVEDGDALWRIARDAPREGASINQMMIALLRANERAFIDGNINRLKRGEILRLPAPDEIAALSRAEADALVAMQNALWNDRHLAAALVPAAAESGVDEPGPELAGGTDVPQPESPTAAGFGQDATGQDSGPRLLIEAADPEAEAIAAQSGIDAEGGGRALARDPQDDAGLLSRAARLQALQERLERLEAVRAESERLLLLREKELAALQARVAELEQARSEEPWYNRPWAFAGVVVLVSGLIAALLVLRREPRGLRYSFEERPGRVSTAAIVAAWPVDVGDPSPASSPAAAKSQTDAAEPFEALVGRRDVQAARERLEDAAEDEGPGTAAPPAHERLD